MRLIIAAITFVITIGGLFLIGNNKAPKNSPAQIIEALKKENINISISPVPPSAPAIQKQVSTPKPSSTPAPSQSNAPIQSSAPTPTPTKTPVPSYLPVSTQTPTPTRTPTPAPTPSSSRTPTPTTTFLPTPTPSQTPVVTPIPTLTPTPTPINTVTPTPTPQETTQNGFINVAIVSSPIKRGLTAHLSITTLPNAQCFIEVILPSGNPSGATGLDKKTADTSGSISWSWIIGSRTTSGDATITLNCSSNGQDFSGSLKMTITSQ